LPRLSFTLFNLDRYVQVIGLVDSGSTVNLLPYDVGLQLGADWNESPVIGGFAGNLALSEARGLEVLASHPGLTPGTAVLLVFAWTAARDVPVIFGHTNFFMEFDVCFYTTDSMFEVNLRAK
jgi:hypothetical protein